MMRDNESARDKENIMREREISYFSTSDTILCIKSILFLSLFALES